MPDFEKKLNEYVATISAQLNLASVDPAMASWFEKNAGPMILPHLRVLMADMAGLYARQMSIAELEAIIGFYDTPMGREIARKQVELQLEMSMPMATMQANYTNELMTAFCKQFDCGSAFGAVETKSGRR